MIWSPEEHLQPVFPVICHCIVAKQGYFRARKCSQTNNQDPGPIQNRGCGFSLKSCLPDPRNGLSEAELALVDGISDRRPHLPLVPGDWDPAGSCPEIRMSCQMGMPRMLIQPSNGQCRSFFRIRSRRAWLISRNRCTNPFRSPVFCRHPDPGLYSVNPALGFSVSGGPAISGSLLTVFFPETHFAVVTGPPAPYFFVRCCLVAFAP
jgi:hypothetical protein